MTVCVFVDKFIDSFDGFRFADMEKYGRLFAIEMLCSAMYEIAAVQYKGESIRWKPMKISKMQCAV